MRQFFSIKTRAFGPPDYEDLEGEKRPARGMEGIPHVRVQRQSDPSRLLNREDSENEIELRMHHVTGLPLGDILMAVTVEP